MYAKKTSIFLRDDVHRKLKVVAAERDTSIQKLMEDAAESIVLPKTETILPSVPALSLTEKSDLVGRFRRILDSGDVMVVLNCRGTVEAMELWIERKKTQADVLTLPTPQAPPSQTTVKPHQRKHGD